MVWWIMIATIQNVGKIASSRPECVYACSDSTLCSTPKSGRRIQPDLLDSAPDALTLLSRSAAIAYARHTFLRYSDSLREAGFGSTYTALGSAVIVCRLEIKRG